MLLDCCAVGLSPGQEKILTHKYRNILLPNVLNNRLKHFLKIPRTKCIVKHSETYKDYCIHSRRACRWFSRLGNRTEIYFVRLKCKARRHIVQTKFDKKNFKKKTSHRELHPLANYKFPDIILL